MGSMSTPLPHSATQVPDGTKPESRGKRFARGGAQAQLLAARYCRPYADVWRRHLAWQTVGRVMDGSGGGRGWSALRSQVSSKRRALPLAGRGRPAPQGPCPADLLSAVGAWGRALIPAGATVVLLDDGECAGTARQATRQVAGWSYVGRTAMRTTAAWAGTPLRRDTLGAWLTPGRLLERKHGHGTREVEGPMMVRCGGAKGEQEPLYVVRQMAPAEAACRWYEKRFRRATLCADQKSRGCHIPKAPMAEAQRLARLCMVAGCAYIWGMYCGSVCAKEQWWPIVHRRQRCDLSLFQLGIRL